LKTLDLRFKGGINSEASELFNQIANNNIELFNELISKISNENLDNFNWWIKSPASRNTYSSPLFYRLTCLKLVNELLDKNKFVYSKILVDSFEFSALIKKLLSEKNQQKTIVYNTQDYSLFTKIIKDNFHKIKTSVFFILKYLIIKILVKKEIILSPIKVVDTFLMPKFVQKDRWYASFFDELNEKEVQNLYFIPTIVSSSIKEFVKIIFKSKNIKRKIIFKESYLSFIDVISIVTNLFNNKFNSKNVKYIDLEINPIIIEEFKFNRDQLTIVESLSIYKLFNNIYKKDIEIELSIDWFEGQSIDKAWSFSLNKFFPNCRTFGYRGGGDFSLHLCNYPIAVEKKANVIPETFLVNGTGYQKLVSKYLKNIKSIVVPSFRTLHVWDDNKTNLKNDLNNIDFKVLVSLPISLTMSKTILNLLICFNIKFENVLNKQIFFIKTHPAFKTDKGFDNLTNQLSENFIFKNNENFNSLLGRSNLLISEASGTCLEAIASCVPVLVIKSTKGLFYNPIPENIPALMFRIVSNVDHLHKQIEFYQNNNLIHQNELIKYSKKVRLKYFEPHNKKINNLIK
jgi:hypothetical protein